MIENKKAITVMFATLESFNILKLQYGIKVSRVLTDNGAEFGSGRKVKPYHPQTNDKIERFWRTLKGDFLEGAVYENIDDLKNELLEYMIYYNEHRPHSAINGRKPVEMTEKYN